ncbi:MAG: ISNCY family transposase [Chloroflexota bacterium]
MDTKQQRRVDILTRLDTGTLDAATAADLLGVSPRHVRRLRERLCREGMPSVVHANRERSPANRTDPVIIAHILELAGPEGKYHDLNACHLHDLLGAVEGIAIGRSTLDRLLRQQGLRTPSRPPAKVYRRRLRRAAEGVLLQMDASPFAWLEGNGPRLSLLGAIDDATGKIVAFLFRPTEDQAGYLALLRAIALDYGLPGAIYHDRHTILRSPKEPTLADELAGRTPQSQVQRLLSELGIESIPAHSPQAKGRVERLWGTLQDRLVKELRLAGITSLDGANAFLPGFIERYNARFAKAPRDPQSAWVPLPAGTDLGYYFAAREERTVRADHCLQWQGQTLQLTVKAGEPSLAKRKVNVHTVPEGMVYLYDGKRRLDYERVEGDKPTAPVLVLPRPKAKEADPRAKARQRAWLFGQR